MGGDDLGSDDEYLFDGGLIGSPGGASSVEDGGGSDDDGDGIVAAVSSSSSQKRKGAGNAGDTASADIPSGPSKKKRKKNDKVNPTNSKSVLIHAGRGIAMDGTEAQAMFLGTIYSHALKMSDGASGAEKDDEGEDEPSSESFSFGSHVYATPETVDEKTKQFQHNNLAAFLKSGPLPSMKRLKNWKHPHSPMILVVTLSARRSVELMKQLSALKLPVAKLFAKHMTVEDQVELLKGVGGGNKNGNAGGGKKGRARCYSLAVGTPGRLLKLLRHGRDGADGVGALRLKHTEVVIIDCHEDCKGWTVCTLADTSRDMMEFLKEGVVPQLEKRKGKIKLAMF